jgi:signal transduction histidine kinase/ActR/RegA family two-component response regulator
MNPSKGTAAAAAEADQSKAPLRQLGLALAVFIMVLVGWSFYLGSPATTLKTAPHWVSHHLTWLSAGPAQGSTWAITLPDSWKTHGLPASGRAKYESVFELPADGELKAETPWAIHIDALCRQHRIVLNRVLLANTQIDQHVPGKMAPVLVDIPLGTLRPGTNLLSIEASCLYQGGMSQPLLAPKSVLVAGYQRQQVFHIALPLATNIAGLCFALFLFMLWWLRGEDASMGLLSAITLVICLSNAVFYVTDDLQLSPTFTGWLHYQAYVVACTMFGLFSLAFTQTHYPVFKRVLQIALTVLTLAGLAALPFDSQLSKLLALAQGPMMLLALPCIFILLRTALKQSPLSVAGFFATCVPLLVTSWHDYYYIMLKGDPLALHWAPVGYPLALPGLYLVLAERFAMVVRQIEQANQTLEQRVAERTADLAAANSAKSDFLAAASHDLRQPMVAIGLITGMLKERAREPEIQSMTGRLSEAVESMEDLLRRLLDLSRLEAGAVEFNPQTVELQGLFNAIVTHELEPARAKGIVLTMRTTGLKVHTDPVLLEQILRNLVGNAVRYTEQGRVLVVARRRGQRCLIQVWDTGIGIAPQDQRRIFDDFVQLGNPGRNAHGGLGLGLALVQRASRLLGADISLQSAPGKGSCFAITLPLVQERESRLHWLTGGRAGPAAESTSSEVPPPPAVPHHVPAPLMASLLTQEHPLAGVQIVVLEDDRAVRMALERRLAAWGAVVFALPSLADLDNELQRIHRPHVLVTDLSLGDGTGLQAIRRAEMAWPGLRSVIITGDTSAHQLQALADCGAPVLHKPFKIEELLEVLVRHAHARGSAAA